VQKMNMEEMKAVADHAVEISGRATVGPWTYPADHCDIFTVATGNSDPGEDIRIEDGGRTEQQVDDDATFVAESRHLVPCLAGYVHVLLARVRELEGQIRAA
jgi:hypothetical protein